ncbi:MAG TPA: beta-propeller domain-containing protein [Polyangia bacterium]|nr:beta-propeller domain-containing protein [Polyangia bacterium]
MCACVAVAGCKSSSDQIGSTSFISSAPAGTNSAGSGDTNGTAAGGAGGGSATAPTTGATTTTTTTRTVQETDLYRLEGTRLYYLSGYRGLMVFDVSNVDQPKLLGHSDIYGSPVDMVVNNGIATVVVGDWYGQMDDGTPFHGSIVRGLDATDPTNIKVVGEAKLGGWVQDDRVVGNVLYAVSIDYGWSYGWDWYGSSSTSVIVSSVNFANGAVQAVGSQTFAGYTGIFNVTPNSILLAHDSSVDSSSTDLVYLDISDPNGAIVQRGTARVHGHAEGWGADNGRWNLDFADGKTAHVIGCAGAQGYCDNTGYILATVDFSVPTAPVLQSELPVPSAGWSVAARFDSGRLYLSPDGYESPNGSTPFQVYDLTNPQAPFLAGSATIPGTVWNILPAPQQRIFALGNDWGTTTTGSTDAVSLKYLDVTDPANPTLIGNSEFGNGWAWTPAAGTFKAFTMDATQGLVVLPFAGWDDTAEAYNNGLQLIEFTPTSETTAGAAHSHGWVERGIFVANRLVSLSDLALSVVDYTNHAAPVVTAELTLARNVVAAQPGGATIAEVSSDWWDNDLTSSQVRVLPIGNSDEAVDMPAAPSVNVDGVDAQTFHNGNFEYVVTNVRVDSACPSGYSAPCYSRAEQIQVVDLSNGGAVLRGKVSLPADPWGWYGWGWWGFYYYDWYDGAEIAQFAPDGLAFRRWEPQWSANGQYLDDKSGLFVVDLANPDAPKIASVTITNDPQGWWGNMRVIGSTLYSSHYEWYDRSGDANGWRVRYYADRIDLSDRSHPRVEAKINTPGILVGGSASDPSLLYTIDYHWDWNSNFVRNELDVVRVSGHTAQLVGRASVDGWIGQTFISGTTAYMAAQHYNDGSGDYSLALHAIDLSNPAHPVDRVAQTQHGWGWLLDVQGDRALVQSGWGPDGLDIYQLSDTAAPKFSQFVRTRGWGINTVSRQDDTLFLSSGYWGVQPISLK